MSMKRLHLPKEAAKWPVVRDWQRLDDLCDGVFDCPHSTPLLSASGPLVVRSQDIRTGVFKTDGAAHVSEATYTERIARAEPRAGDILYSREGTYFGIAAEMPPDKRVCLGQRMVLIRPSKQLNPRFLRFWLNSPVMTRHLHGFRDGSVAERLNMPTIRSLPIPRFERTEQDHIATVLGALDDKIELDRCMNVTLEATARAIFDEWFVDFGPIHAKMEGRAAYLSPELWGLFPDTLNDDGLPVGWGTISLGDIARNAVRACAPHQITPGTPYIALDNMPRRSIALNDWTTSVQIESGKLRFQKGEFLFGKLRPYFHKVGIAPVDGVCTTDAVVISAKQEKWSAIVLMTLSSDEFVAYTDRGSTGTKMPRTKWKEMAKFPLTLPLSSALIDAYGNLVAPLVNRIVANVLETPTLVAVRDLLLPKLMSGELQLRDAERVVRELV